MTNNPFLAHCTNMFEETHLTTEPRNTGAENLYFSQSQSRKIFDTTLTSISPNPLQNYNVPSLTMNNGDSALTNQCVNYAQPSPVAGGGFLFSFASPQHNFFNMPNTGHNFNSYGHQQPNQPNYYNFTNKSNPLFSSHPNLFSPCTSPTPLQENTQKEIPFKLQFHLQRGTSTSDLPEMQINNINYDEEMAFMKKMTDLHHMWKDRTDMCSKLSHFDPFRKYGLNKVLHLSKSPDLKAKKGKFYEIDITQECDICQNNISQTLQLFENEKNGLHVNQNCLNNDEIKAKEKDLRRTTTTATETLMDLKDESLQTESNIWNKNVPMDTTDDHKTDNKEDFLKDLKKSSVFDKGLLKNSKENYVDENIEEILDKKVQNLLNYFPQSILKKFRLLENEITNLLLKTMQMSEDGKHVCSEKDLAEIIQREETGLEPKNFDRDLVECLINKGRPGKRHLPEFETNDDLYELQTHKILRLTQNSEPNTTSQTRNNLKVPKEFDDESIKEKTLSDKSVSCKESISNFKPKNSDTKPVQTKIEDNSINTNCISSQILSQADEKIQKWQDIITKKIQMFENGIREVFMNTKNFPLMNCSDITEHPVISEINSKNIDDFNMDTVSYLGNFLDKIITLQKSPDVLDKINKPQEEYNENPTAPLDRKFDKNQESKSNFIEEKPELIIPEESLRLNHGLDIEKHRVTSEIKLPKTCCPGEMDFDNFSLKTSSKRKLCETDPMVYSSSDYSPTKRANVNINRKNASDNYIQGYWMKSNEKYHRYSPKYTATKRTSENKLFKFGNDFQKYDISNQHSFNSPKSDNSVDIKKSITFSPTTSLNIEKSNHCSSSEITDNNNSNISAITNDDDDQTKIEQRKSISKIIDDIHTQIWGTDKNPPKLKSHYFAKNFKKSDSFDKYKRRSNHNEQKDKTVGSEFNSNKIKSETELITTNSKYKFLEDDHPTDAKTLRKNYSSGYGTSSASFRKSKFHENNKNSTHERSNNSFTKSKFIDDFQSTSQAHSRSFERRSSLPSKSKFLEDFDMSKSIVDTIINKSCEDSDGQHYQQLTKDDNKFSSSPEVIRKSKIFLQNEEERTMTLPRKSKSLTSINEEAEVSEKSSGQKINLWQNKIPRAFAAKETKELSRSKMHLFDNWRKKLQENKTRGSKCNIYQRPSFKKKVPRALLTDDSSRTEIEDSLESYDKSTREMEKKLNEALQRYNKTAKVTDEISKKYIKTSDNDPLYQPTSTTTTRTFLADTGQKFLTKVENVLKANMNGNFEDNDENDQNNDDKPYCLDTSTMEPSVSFDDEEIRSVEYSRSYVISNSDDNDNDKDEKYSEN